MINLFENNVSKFFSNTSPFLYRTHMQDLKFITDNIHYENFRYNKLATVTSANGNKTKSTSSK